MCVCHVCAERGNSILTGPDSAANSKTRSRKGTARERSVRGVSSVVCGHRYFLGGAWTRLKLQKPNTHTHTHAHADKHTHKHTHKQTHTDTYTQPSHTHTHKHTHTHTHTHTLSLVPIPFDQSNAVQTTAEKKQKPEQTEERYMFSVNIKVPGKLTFSETSVVFLGQTETNKIR